MPVSGFETPAYQIAPALQHSESRELVDELYWDIKYADKHSLVAQHAGHLGLQVDFVCEGRDISLDSDTRQLVLDALEQRIGRQL